MSDTYEEYTLAGARLAGDVYDLDLGDGSHFCVSVDKCKSPPQAGDAVRLYGRGMGYPIRGVAINGAVLYHETEDEYQSRVTEERRAADAEKKAAADANRAEADARVASLPECFQKRVQRFRANNPDFYWEHEGYEMASCVDAVKIADALGTLEAVRDFHALPWDEQKAAVPDLSDGHSGNTFGMACRLAHHYLTDERLVFAEHAAISALVGCDGAGCPPVTDGDMTAAGYAPFNRDAA